MQQTKTIENPDWEISGKSSWWSGWDLHELWQYRNLLARLVRRDFLVNYQQTILGPLWILLQPLLTLVTFVLVGQFINLPTGTVPPVLFYLSGIVLWNFFSESFIGNAFTFTFYSHIFTKVYFPRLIIPLSVLSAHFLRFVVQFVMLLMLLLYYYLFKNLRIDINASLLFLPVAIILTGMFSIAIGLIFSVLTAKYRDLANVVHLGIRLAIFITPVIYPVSYVRDDAKWIVSLNPLTPLFEAFRYALLGEGYFTQLKLLYSFLFITILFLIGVLFFNKQGDKLMDVV